ncbi:MAG TPA: serine--tRNA ligase [Chitinispirillaceae bacterium]|jgi:seryl-tRNA synthetase|nr:serine--tRNA ligase [Chitinispirillaceae bacterium]
MLDIQRIRDNADQVRQVVLNKKSPVDIDAVLSLDNKRRDTIQEVERLKNLRNTRSIEIAALKKEKKDASALIDEMKSVSERIKALDTELGSIESEIQEYLIRIPNIPHSSVPHGESEKDNVAVSEWGETPQFDFKPRDHLELGTALDIIDFPRGAKIAGAGFPVLKGAGALLERALINFFLDTHTRKNGYLEIFPPFLANRASHFGTGQLPKSEDQMYYINEDDLFCIPTAEVPVTNLHRDEVLDQSVLPVKYCAYSACFRREAGSYGKDTKGYLRVHQFNKVELVKYTTPETSYDEHEALRKDAEGILQALGLKYRVLLLCDADLSFAAAKCYDLEAWAPGEGKFLEVSSCSNFEDFQARRANIRYRPQGGGKPRFVHTLNGSGLATARILVAILETYQTAQGTVRIPEVLQPYMNGIREIKPR